MPSLAYSQSSASCLDLFIPVRPERTGTYIFNQVITADLTDTFVLIVNPTTEPTRYRFSSSAPSQSQLLTESEPDLNYEILRPIPVVIEENDSRFIASFGEANIHSSGETASEALNNLKSYIGDIFEEFLAIGRERLGPGPSRELTILEKYIQERNAE